MTLFQQLKFALSKPPRGQIKFIVTTYIDGIISKRFYGKSLTGNFLQLVYLNMAQNETANFVASGSPWTSLTSCKDITGTMRAVYNQLNLKLNAAIGIDEIGIICGSGTTTPAAADYVCETPIDHGTAAGELSYQQQTSTQGCEIASLTTSFILQRLFVNNSGGQVDVNEICLNSFYSAYRFLIYRDVLVSADEIPNGSTYRVTIELSVTT